MVAIKIGNVIKIALFAIIAFSSCSRNSTTESWIEKSKKMKQGTYTPPVTYPNPQYPQHLHIPKVQSNGNYVEKPQSRTVYICTGPRAYAYHYDEWCSGLNRCHYEVKTTTENKAKKYRSPCRICVE